MFKDASTEEINHCLKNANDVFAWYRHYTPIQKRDLLYGIAHEIEQLGEALIETAFRETRLPLPRLRLERSRTIKQLTLYADYAAAGHHLDIRIDTPNTTGPDIRKMNIPLGPVVVFGASNFPFAYSTAGGDTASALAAGCTVIVKAHPAHAGTSQMVADAITRAIHALNMPSGIFQHVHGISNHVGEALVKHPLTQAVGFTGSQTGGKQLFDWGNQRPKPIPVFAEMGSINPVYLFPEKLAAETEKIAGLIADSICLGSGQYCTNPGILVALKGATTDRFADCLSDKLDGTPASSMLHPGICQRYYAHRDSVLSQHGVIPLSQRDWTEETAEHVIDPAIPMLARVDAASFLSNPVLYQEVFGPFSLLVVCSDPDQMSAVAASMPGQLTSSIHATEQECINHQGLLDTIIQHAGRIIFNGVPTGIEVCPAMHHGGPYPATTDSRFTSVGPDAIRRFVRPVCFQNCPAGLLPEALWDENPHGYRRMVHGEWTG